jgi:hypothetical protein
MDEIMEKFDKKLIKRDNKNGKFAKKEIIGDV